MKEFFSHASASLRDRLVEMGEEFGCGPAAFGF